MTDVASALLARLGHAGAAHHVRQPTRRSDGDAFAAYAGHASRRSRVRRRCHRARRRKCLVGSAGLRLESRLEASAVAGAQDLKARLGGIADFIYGHPSRDLWMVGVTGTNGKTSCAHWIAAGLHATGRKSAVLGTLGNGLARRLATGSEHDAGRGLVAGNAGQDALRRRASRRDGSLLARTRSGARERRRVRCRAVHQSVARSSRLSRDDGGVRRGQGAPVRVAWSGGRRHQRG